MLVNPYSPGDRPRTFVGRRDERARLRGQLARVVAYGEMMGPLTVVTGPRGVGKTSLLRDVGDSAAADGFVVAWVVGVKRQPFWADLVAEVTRATARIDALARSGVKRRVEELGIELNA
ncbi:MAG: ATP-binding protein, partial [Bifidobacteriaceae bacterium]|nr:ATP-binding protein [Bifidobacteriaceae bacterium]